jgi:hypothetical protein
MLLRGKTELVPGSSQTGLARSSGKDRLHRG